MNNAETITRVRAAKTSGECRKAIADASFSLEVSKKIRDKFEQAQEALEASGMDANDIVSMLGDSSTRIRLCEAEANRSLLSVLNAIAKAFDGVKEITNVEDKLKATREVFEITQGFIPQTDK